MLPDRRCPPRAPAILALVRSARVCLGRAETHSIMFGSMPKLDKNVPQTHAESTCMSRLATTELGGNRYPSICQYGEEELTDVFPSYTLGTSSVWQCSPDTANGQYGHRDSENMSSSPGLLVPAELST